jgi:hypothetical protein
MSPPADPHSFQLLPEEIGSIARAEQLEDGLSFAGVETPDGWVDAGQTAIEFEPDGTATHAEVHLEDDSGHGLVLDVLPLAETVRIHDAEQ